jgi:hypothetical protein
MPLDRTMTYSAVRVCGSNDEHDYQAVGTGFFMSVPGEVIQGGWHGYVVTPHHVIDGLRDIHLEIANPTSPGELYPRIAVSDWRRSDVYPDADLAFARFLIPEGQMPIALQLGALVIPNLEVRAASNFHYVGLLAPLDVPMVRSGTIGATWVDGLGRERGYSYQAHLADVRSYGGFSGSPCFLEYPFPRLRELDVDRLPFKMPANYDASIPIGTVSYVHLFCGMFTSHFEDRTISGYASNLGVGVVLPADTIIETVTSEAVRAERRAEDEHYLRTGEPPTMPVVEAADPWDTDDDDRNEGSG